MSEQPEQTGQLTDAQKDQAAAEQGTQRTPLTGQQPTGDNAQTSEAGSQGSLTVDEQAALDQKHRDNMDPNKQADVPRTAAGKNEGVGMNAGEGKPGEPVDPVQYTAPMNPENPGFNQRGQTQIREGLYQHPEQAGELTMRDTGDASQYAVTRKIREADEAAKAKREGREPNPHAADAVKTSDSKPKDQE